MASPPAGRRARRIPARIQRRQGRGLRRPRRDRRALRQLARWHQWWARVWRLIEAETDPDAKRRRTEREITADQRFTRGARLKQAERPGALTPLESCVLRRIHPGDPGAEVSDAPR